MKLLISFCLLAAALTAHAAPDDTAYFEQFLYRKVNLEKDPDFPPRYQYYFLGSLLGYRVDLNAKENLIVRVSVFLNADGTWLGVYDDGVEQKANPGSWIPRKCKELKGTWSVPGKNLVIYDENKTPLIEGQRLFKDGQNMVAAQMLEGFPVSEVRTSQFPMGIYQAEQEPLQRCFFGPTP